MSRTAITPQTPIHGSALVSPAAEAAKITYTAADSSNGNTCPITGRELLLVKNTDTAAHTITISSAPDAEGRSSDITAYSIPASEEHVFGPFDLAGWSNSGQLNFTANSNLLSIAVLQLPHIQ